MGKQLVEKMMPALDQMKWPSKPMATEQGRQTYEVGVDKVNAYDGEPKTLVAALRTFQTGDSLPYAYAGVAYTLMTAARETDGTYDAGGLEAAMGWLEKAQDAEPDVVDINVLEALIYVYSGRLDDARLLLDFLQAQDPASYHVHAAEVAYWWARGDVPQTVHWFDQASAAAITVPQRQRLRARMGEFYLEFGQINEALAVFKELVRLEPENARMWHRLSVVHYRREDYEEALQANKRALKLDDFAQARQMEAALKRKMGTGMLGRFFGR